MRRVASSSLATKHGKFIGNNKFIQKHELPFELIVDQDAVLHEKFGTWREKSMYGKTYMGTLRSTFAIGSDGKIEGNERTTRGKLD